MPAFLRIPVLAGSGLVIVVVFIILVIEYGEKPGTFDEASFQARESARAAEKNKADEFIRREKAKNAAQNYSNFSQEYNNAVKRGDKGGAISAANRRDRAYSEWMKNQ